MTTAEQLGKFYDELRQRGFPEDEARSLVRQAAHQLFISDGLTVSP